MERVTMEQAVVKIENYIRMNFNQFRPFLTGQTKENPLTNELMKRIVEDPSISGVEVVQGLEINLN